MNGPRLVVIPGRSLPLLGLGFLALMVGVVGLGLLFDGSSPPVARAVGLAIALVFGLGAWLALGKELSSRPSLRLDPAGLRLRLPPPQMGFDVPWPDLVAVRVAGRGEHSAVVLDVVDPDAPVLYPGGDPPVESRPLPRLRAVRAEDLAREIERFHRAYRDAPAPVRREDMM